MKKVLFMHGGSGNHGCEAIVRTTAHLLGGPDNMILWSWDRSQDVKYGTAAFVEEVAQTDAVSRFSLPYFEAQIRKRLLRQPDAFRRAFLRKLFRESVAISIGGDNYCYPWSAQDAVETDKQIRAVCRNTVLWGCSVDKDSITPEVREDLEKFDLITARESISYQVLKDINPNTVLVADPAFLLKKVELPLPDGFLKYNTVGINVSPLIMGYGDGSIIMSNYVALIRHIIKNTSMNVCLIPHVVWENNNDLEPINVLYDQFADTGRVCKVNDGNAEEMKGYIARCRFFVGARTHATIAAYSCCVPTLVAGYSVKSLGIAQDLFGTSEGYVVPVKNLTDEQEFVRRFAWLMEHEDDVIQRLQSVMPAYIQRAESAKDAFDAMVER